MRNIVWCLLVVTLFAGSCKKNSDCGYSEQNITAPASEQQAVTTYLSTSNITAALKDSSGLYYEIIQPGAGGYPNLCSQVEVTYTGALTNGTVFETSPGSYFTLGALIEGWKKGIPRIQKGGRIKLYIPPTLGYGNVDMKDKYGTVVIPANSVLIFDITLTGFN